MTCLDADTGQQPPAANSFLSLMSSHHLRRWSLLAQHCPNKHSWECLSIDPKAQDGLDLCLWIFIYFFFLSIFWGAFLPLMYRIVERERHEMGGREGGLTHSIGPLGAGFKPHRSAVCPWSLNLIVLHWLFNRLCCCSDVCVSVFFQLSKFFLDAKSLVLTRILQSFSPDG